MTKNLTVEEKKFLKEAKKFLESESFIIKLTNSLGKPVDGLIKALPKKHEKLISEAVEKSLTKSLSLAVKSVEKSKNEQIDFINSVRRSHQSRYLHSGLGVFTGVGGGAFGLPGLVVELPLTTTLIMRSIVNTANKFGFSGDDPGTALQCLSVFTMGASHNQNDDYLDTVYYSTRLVLAETLRASTNFMTKNTSQAILQSLERGSAPALLNFINRVATYFQVTVSEKVLAGSVPVVGALGGASLNYLFMDYYSQVATYHFGILSLEKKYGSKNLQAYYTSIIASE